MKTNFVVLFLLFVMAAVAASAQRYGIDSFDIRKGAGPSQVYSLTPLHKTLYFGATNITEFNRLYKIDHNNQPVIVPDQNNKSIVVEGMCGLNNILYFSGDFSATGSELYMYDGSNPPTLVADIVPGNQGSSPSNLTAFDNKLFFTTVINGFPGLTVYDPATQAVRFLTAKSADTFRNNGGIEKLRVFDNKLYFSGTTNEYGEELHVYLPNTDTIMLVTDLYPGSKSSSPEDFVIYNNIMYFTANDSTHGKELWKTDGSGILTRLTDMIPGTGNGVNTTANGAGGQRLGAYKDKLFFNAELPGKPGYYLCTYDIGTGTAGYFQTLQSAMSYFTYGGNLYFSAFYNKTHLYQYDGSDTAGIVVFDGGYKLSGYNISAQVNNSVYLDATGSNIGRELFKFTDSVVSVQRIPSLTDATICPNPVTQDASLAFSLTEATDIGVQLTAVNGRMVYQQPQQIYQRGKHTIILPMQDLPPGMYVYQLKDAGGRMIHTGKIVKQ